MGFLGRVLRRHPQASPRVRDMAARILALHPHLRLARHSQARLEQAVGEALDYLDALVARLPAPRLANARAWLADACMRAWFASPADVAAVISRSPELRDWFDSHAGAPEVFAVLGMEVRERHGFGAAMENGTLRQDVPQTSMDFTDHQLRLCGASLEELKQEIVRRLVDQLAMEGLAQAAASRSRRTALQNEQALLKTRLQLLQRQGAGMPAVLGGQPRPSGDALARVQQDLEANEHALASLGLQSDALERELDTLCQVLAEPAPHLFLSRQQLRLNHANVVQENGADGEKEEDGTVSEVELHFARLPTTPPRMRAFSLVRFSRSELLPAPRLLDEAARLLGPRH